jgi:hypothetical protein
LGIIRLENASLAELIDLALEIFDQLRPPIGSVLMVGSVSHLHVVGSAAYCADWASAVRRLECRWGGINICPLVPVIREDYPIGLARELLELASWLATVYSGTTRGLGDVWLSLVDWLSLSVADALSSPPVQFAYTISLPESLAGGNRTTPHSFLFPGSRST